MGWLPNPCSVEKRFRCLALVVAGLVGAASLVYGFLQLRLLVVTRASPQETVAETTDWGALPDLALCGETEVSFAYGQARVPPPLCHIPGRCSGLQHRASGDLASGGVDLGLSVFNNYGGLCKTSRVLFIHSSRLRPSFGTARADVLRHGRRNALEISISYLDSAPDNAPDHWDGLSLYAISGDYFSGLYTTSALAFLGAFSAGSLVGEVTALSLEKVQIEDFRGTESSVDLSKLAEEEKRLVEQVKERNTSGLLDELQTVRGMASAGSQRFLAVAEAAQYRGHRQVPIHVANPWVPAETVPHVHKSAADFISSASDKLRVVSFEVTVDKETVTVIVKGSRFQRMMGLVGSLGGYLAGLGALFGCCFVRRHPAASGSKVYEELTLRGCSSPSTDPLIADGEGGI